jgi:hypothetical protein
MPFLVFTDISNSIPAGNEAKVENILVKLETELTNAGMVFSSPTSSTYSIKPDREGQKVFDFGYFSEITEVKLKDTSSSSERLLVEGQDYSKAPHPNLANIYSRIEVLTNQSLFPPYYLAVSAKSGIFIDFSDNSLASKNLKAIIIDWITKLLFYAKKGNREVIESKTGDSQVKYSESTGRQYYSQILQDPEFISQLNYYFI